MQTKELMTQNIKHIPPFTSLDSAAQIMRDLDCGFLPVSDTEGKKLQGVITDRDIAVRGVAEGAVPAETRVDQIMSANVLHCYADDDVETTANNMREMKVYRLIVLNNREENKLCGIISLGDFLRHDQDRLSSSVAKEICRQNGYQRTFE